MQTHQIPRTSISARAACTAKEASFVEKYVEIGTASEAYMASLYKTCRPDLAKRRAWELLQKPPVLAYLAELKDQANARCVVTIAGLTEKLEAAYRLAQDIEQPAAMTQAVMAMAKLHGLDVQKVEHKHQHSVDIAGAADQLFSLLSNRKQIQGGVGGKMVAGEMAATPPRTSASFLGSDQPEVEDAEIIEGDDE